MLCKFPILIYLTLPNLSFGLNCSIQQKDQLKDNYQQVLNHMIAACMFLLQKNKFNHIKLNVKIYVEKYHNAGGVLIHNLVKSKNNKLKGFCYYIYVI